MTVLSLVDWKLWRFILLTAIVEIIIAIVITIILIINFPGYAVVIILAVIGILILYLWIRYYIYKPVIHHHAIDPRDEIMGQMGVAITDLTPRGQVKIRREVWSARSMTGSIVAGTKIEVIEMDGIHLIVKHIKE